MSSASTDLFCEVLFLSHIWVLFLLVFGDKVMLFCLKKKKSGFLFFGISLDQWITIFMDAEIAKYFSNAYIWNPPSNGYSAVPLQKLC